MTYQDMSDEDLTAVVSFLRAQEPVHSPVEKTELSFMGRALMAFGAVKPVFPMYPLQESVPRVNKTTYGKYVSDVLANCLGCHTERDGSDGFGGLSMQAGCCLRLMIMIGISAFADVECLPGTTSLVSFNALMPI